MYALRTLVGFELRQIRNELRSVARSRLRVVVWTISALAFVAFIASRVVSVRLTNQMQSHLDHTSAAIYAGLYVGYTSLSFMFAYALGAQFASVAEALLVGASRLEPRAIFLWLQLRAVGRTLFRSFIVLVILATNGSATATESARMTILGFAVILIPAAYAFHIAIASPRKRNAIRVCGLALFLFAIAIGLDKVPGAANVMLAQVHGAWWPTLAALAIAAIGIVVPPLRDPIPELFAATRSGGIRAQRIAEKRARKTTNGGKTSEWIFDLSGVWVILSGRLAAFFRVRAPRVFALGLLLWFVGGLGAGIGMHLAGHAGDDIIVYSAGPLIMIVTIVAAAVGRDLGLEIRNPLWWIGDATMTARLGVDSIASLWRFIVSMAAVLAGYAAFDHAQVAFAIFLVIGAVVWLARCCGYMLFAFFPSPLDQRGALAGLRIFALFLLAVPVATAAAIVTVTQFPFVFAVTIVVLVALVQAILLLALAARRIDGRIEAYLVV